MDRRIICKCNDPTVLEFLKFIGVDAENCTHFVIEGGVKMHLTVTETRRVRLSEPTIEKPRLVPTA